MWWHRRRRDEDFDREIRAHLDLEVDRLISEGMPPAQARATAHRRFGNVTKVKERFYEAGRIVWIDQLQQDLRYAFGALGRAPGFTLAAVSVLALGIGATVAIFSIVDRVIVAPLPFYEPDQLVMIWQQDRQGDLREVSYREFQGWRAQSRSFAAMAAIGSVNWRYQTSDADEPYSVSINAVSASFFDTLGARPILGRTFVPSDDAAVRAAGRVIVLSHALWTERFDANPSVIGQHVRLVTTSEEAVPFTIIGVMPPAFRFPNGVQLWTPVGPELESIRRTGNRAAALVPANKKKDPRYTGIYRDIPRYAGI